MSILSKIGKMIEEKIPGSAMNVAREKRKLEKELRAAGYSRKNAATLVAERFQMKNLFKPGFTATGMAAKYLPPGAECDELLTLIRLGQRFRMNHVGKRPGALSRLICDCARRGGPPFTFEKLLGELELGAARRELHGEAASLVEKVDRVWGLATVHLPKRGRVQVPFSTLRNHLTQAKNILLA
jgi:hypothetical protein